MYKQLLLAFSIITASSVVLAQPGSVTLQAAQCVGNAALKASDAVVSATVSAAKYVAGKAKAFDNATEALLNRIGANPDVFFAGVAYLPAVFGAACAIHALPSIYTAYEKRKARERGEAARRNYASAPIYDCYPRN